MKSKLPLFPETPFLFLVYAIIVISLIPISICTYPFNQNARRMMFHFIPLPRNLYSKIDSHKPGYVDLGSFTVILKREVISSKAAIFELTADFLPPKDLTETEKALMISEVNKFISDFPKENFLYDLISDFFGSEMSLKLSKSLKTIGIENIYFHFPVSGSTTVWDKPK